LFFAVIGRAKNCFGKNSSNGFQGYEIALQCARYPVPIVIQPIDYVRLEVGTVCGNEDNSIKRGFRAVILDEQKT